MAKELEDKLLVLAKRMDIEQVPTWQVKTTLQQAVQALKRHRDILLHRRARAPTSLDHHHYARRPRLPWGW